LNFLTSFLSNRFIRTICFDKYSDWFQINCGTPQGSCLGPILFCIYINDLLDEITNDTKCIPSTYADDIALLPTNINDSLESQLEQLQLALNICSKWAITNHMQFSSNKSNIMCFTNSDTLNPYIQSQLEVMKLSGFQLPEFNMKVVTHYKYVGIEFNSNVRKLFKLHLSELIKKVHFKVYQVNRVLTAATPIMVGIQLASAIVRSVIGYGLIFTKCGQSYANKLQGLLAKPLKRALGLPKTASTLGTLAECGISTLGVWREKMQLQYANKLSKLNLNHLSNKIFYSEDYYQYDDKTKIDKSIYNDAAYAQTVRFAYEIKELEGLASNSFGTRWAPAQSLNNNNNNNNISISHQQVTREQLKQCELQNSYNELVYSGKAKRLIQLKSVSMVDTKRELYIKHDPPLISKYRARFRFNIMKTNETLYKYRLRSNPYCDECKDQIESREHTLLHCPIYDLKRYELINRLNYVQIPLNINIILGDVSSVKSQSSQLDLLKWTGDFIEYVVIARKL
jgi:hypothetical protein